MMRADIYFEMGDYENSKKFMLKALEITNNYRSWIETDDYFNGRCYDQLSLVCNELGDYLSAIAYCTIALKYKPNDERLLNNLDYFIKEVVKYD